MKNKDQTHGYIESLAIALNTVEHLRTEACTTFRKSKRIAAKMWRTAHLMERNLIIQNGLPDVDAMLNWIFNKAQISTGYNCEVGAKWHSYLKSVSALMEICSHLDNVFGLFPMLRMLVKVLEKEGENTPYLPTKEMVEYAELKEDQEVQNAG